MKIRFKNTLIAILLFTLLIIPQFSFSNTTVNGDTIDTYYCMRDDYIISTEQQNTTGLCWLYTSNKILETLFAKKYNAYYDFSETFIALCDKKYSIDNNEEECLIGAGGSLERFLQLISTYGIMLEEDLSQDYLYNLDSENYIEYYNMYSKYASKKYLSSLQIENFVDSKGVFTQTQILNIKNHIYKTSAVYLRVNSAQIDETKKILDDTINEPESFHSVTIIGWDDYREVVDSNGNTHKGTWIALNSWGDDWGDDGILYIPYDCSSISNCAGLSFKDDVNLNEFILEKTMNNYKILNYWKYSTQMQQKDGFIIQYNVFDKNSNNLELSYNMNLQDGYVVKSVEIYRSGENKTDDFIISFPTDSKLHIISKDITQNLEWGTYKIFVTFENNEQEILNFYVLSGAEISYCKVFYSGNFTSKYASRNLLVNNFATNVASLQDEYLKIDNQGVVTIAVYMGTYSKITDKINNFNHEDAQNKKVFEDISEKDGKDYSSGYFYVSFGLNNGKNTTNVTIETIDGYRITYKFVIYRYGIIGTIEEVNETAIYSLSRVSIAYDLNGGQNNKENPQGVSYNYLRDNNLELFPAKKDGYTFNGWYLSGSETRIDSLTIENVNVYSGTNYILNMFYINGGTKTVFLYADYIKIDISDYTYNLISSKRLNTSQNYYDYGTTEISLGNILKLELNNIDFNVVDNVVPKDTISYKIYWNDSTDNMEYYETPFTFESLLIGEKTIKCEVKFYYLENYEIGSCSQDFIVYFNYNVVDMEIYGDNVISGTIYTPAFNFSGYTTLYSWYYYNEDNEKVTIGTNRELLLNDIIYANKLIYCTTTINTNNSAKNKSFETTTKTYVFNGQYNIVLNDTSKPIVENHIKVESNLVEGQNENVQVEYKWICEDNVIGVGDTLISIPSECANKLLYCEITLTNGDYKYIQETQKVRVIDYIKYVGNAIYGEIFSINDLSDDYTYEYEWSNLANTKSIELTKNLVGTQINCKITIYLTDVKIGEVTLDDIFVNKRDIEIVIDDKQSSYREEERELTYHFSDGKNILTEDLPYFDIELTKENNSNIGTYVISLSKIEYGEMDSYYGNYTVIDGLYTISKINFDFTNTKMIISSSNNEEYVENSLIYNGTTNILSLINLPSGIIVKSYKNNIGTDARTYQLKIQEYEFSEEYAEEYQNYYNLDDITNYVWEWKINRQQVDFYYTWDYTSAYTYSGQEYEVCIQYTTPLPEGIELIYTDNKKIYAGNYTAICEFNQDNLTDKNYTYNFIGNNLDWTIDKYYYALGSSWNNWEYTSPYIYNGEQQQVKIEFNGDIEYGIVVEYTNNKFTDAGNYTASAQLVYNANNIEMFYSQIEDLDWEIMPYEIDLDEYDWYYELDSNKVKFNKEISIEYPAGKTINLHLCKTTPSGIEHIEDLFKELNIKYFNNECAIISKYEVSLEIKGNNNYNILNTENTKCSLEITKYKNEIIVDSELSSVYNGKIKELNVTSTRKNVNNKVVLYFEYIKDGTTRMQALYNSGVYKVTITDKGDDYWEPATKTIEYIIYRNRISTTFDDKYIEIESSDGFSNEAMLVVTQKLSEAQKKAVESRLKFTRIIELYRINTIDDYEKDGNNIVLTFKPDSSEITHFTMAVRVTAQSKIEVLDYMIKSSNCKIYCNTGDVVILINAQNFAIISIWILIAVILAAVMLAMLVRELLNKRMKKFATYGVAEGDNDSIYDEKEDTELSINEENKTSVEVDKKKKNSSKSSKNNNLRKTKKIDNKTTDDGEN